MDLLLNNMINLITKLGIIFLLLISTRLILFANDSTVITLPLLDLPYIQHSIETRPTNKPLGMLSNPSMNQSLELSKSLYTGFHWGIQKGFPPNTNRYGYQYIALFAGDIAAYFMPLGDAWLHEEYHRAVLTKHNVHSYNAVYDMKVGGDYISVNDVRDEDLVRMKHESNADFVRASAAGIEGELLLVHELHKDAFSSGQSLPHCLTYLMIMVSESSYVIFSGMPDAKTDTDTFEKEEGANVRIRDWVGLDFTAWTYDLFRPNDPYENRGIHPSGVGIKRYIRPSDMTLEEQRYLKKQGWGQLINYANPAIFAYDDFVLSHDSTSMTTGSASLHRYLTSFGAETGLNLYYKQKGISWLFTYHHYQNYKSNFPGAEIEVRGKSIQLGTITLPITLRVMAWLQPHGQSFRSKAAQAGGLVGATIQYPFAHRWRLYGCTEAKTEGWVAGNVYLGPNISLRCGMQLAF